MITDSEFINIIDETGRIPIIIESAIHDNLNENMINLIEIIKTRY